jgi:HAD superfamily hydrolase (TIGR01490 family)
LKLALFDLDNTLLDGDSDVEWTALLAARGLCDASIVARFHDQYDAGTLDIDAFLRFQIGVLAAHPLDDLIAWRREFVEQRIRPRLARDAGELVAPHARAGHTCALVTATNRFLVEPIAALLALPHVVATEPEFVAGRYTGRWLEPACFRAGKIECVEQWLASRRLAWPDVDESWFYSDSHNDIPLLARVTHAVAVRPDAALAEHARRHGWRVIR